jgi:hypothetical protein
MIASLATKGPTYHCPGCGEEVILKQGRKVIHHFAHKPPVTCSWAAGETTLHLKAKEAFYEHFKRLGMNVEVEYPLNAGRLRADVYVIGKNGKPVVFELQHSSILPGEIERRTNEYFKLGITLIWVSVFKPGKLDGKQTRTGMVVERYTPKPFERWLHGFNFGKIWYFDPENASLWHGRFDKSMIDVPVSEWYESGGTHVSVGGYSRISKRWKKLTLTGPFQLDQVRYEIKRRDETRLGGHWYPAGSLLNIEISKG